jgi:hypothetical protein
MTAPQTDRPVTDTVIWADDFAVGLDADGPDSPWQLRPLGGLPGGDGTISTPGDRLVVAPMGTNGATGEPSFRLAGDDAPHMRWAALANRTSEAGFPGFPVSPPDPLVISGVLAARAFGLGGHPYGEAVTEPERDSRLAAGALIALDRESGMVFDFLVTERAVLALYERLPQPGGGSFSYAVPIAERRPDQFHRCTIEYHPADGVVVWRLDGREVLRVDDIGRRVLDPGHLTRDDGQPVDARRPRQLAAGLGLLAERTWGQGLRLEVRSITVARRLRATG